MSEQVAIGIALGGLGAMMQLALLRYSAQLLREERARLAWAVRVLAYVPVLAALATSFTIAPLAALACVVGVLGARTFVYGEAAPSPP